jgi:hypothetical protein
MRLKKLYARLAAIDAASETRYIRISLGTLVAVYIMGGFYLVAEWNATRFAVGAATPVDLAIPLVDDRIPIVPVWIWPYILYVPLLIVTGLLHTPFRDFLFVCANYVLASTVGYAFFILLPAQMQYPVIDCVGVSCEALRQLYAMDGGVNIFPSLHVSHSLLAAAAFCYTRSRFFPMAAVVAGAIAAATLFTGQHYVIDLPAGLLNALFVWHVNHYLLRRLAGDQRAYAAA